MDLFDNTMFDDQSLEDLENEQQQKQKDMDAADDLIESTREIASKLKNKLYNTKELTDEAVAVLCNGMKDVLRECDKIEEALTPVRRLPRFMAFISPEEFAERGIGPPLSKATVWHRERQEELENIRLDMEYFYEDVKRGQEIEAENKRMDEEYVDKEAEAEAAASIFDESSMRYSSKLDANEDDEGLFVVQGTKRHQDEDPDEPHENKRAATAASTSAVKNTGPVFKGVLPVRSSQISGQSSLGGGDAIDYPASSDESLDDLPPRKRDDGIYYSGTETSEPIGDTDSDESDAEDDGRNYSRPIQRPIQRLIQRSHASTPSDNSYHDDDSDDSYSEGSADHRKGGGAKKGREREYYSGDSSGEDSETDYSGESEEDGDGYDSDEDEEDKRDEDDEEGDDEEEEEEEEEEERGRARVREWEKSEKKAVYMLHGLTNDERGSDQGSGFSLYPNLETYRYVGPSPA